MSIPLGLGVYPNADINLIKQAVPKGSFVLIMDLYNKGFVTGLQDYICVKRVYIDNPSQLDFTLTPAQNAMILFQKLTNDPNFHLYQYCVGWNEAFNTREHYQFIADAEVILCTMLHGVGMKYLWGSINVGNIDVNDFVTIFDEINAIADGINYHGYLPPNTTSVVSDPNYDYVGLPYKWWHTCKIKGVRFPPLFFGESGTYYQWKSFLNTEQYVKVLIDINNTLNAWQKEGMPVLGNNAFAIGTEGVMGNQWNIEDVSAIKDYNAMATPSTPVQDVITGNGAWIWYKNFSPDIFNDLDRNNFDWLIVKYADGNSFGDSVNHTVFQTQFKSLIQPLHDRHLKVYAYSYIYLDDPVGEARAIAQAVLHDHADGIVLDPEYECINRFKQAQLFFDTLWSLIPKNTLVSYSPDFRILEGNTYLPWKDNRQAEPWPWEIFNANCNYVMPQLYWTDFQVTPAIAFDLVDIFIKDFPNGPRIIPVFPSNCTGAELTVAFQYSDKYQFPGCSMWRFDDLSPAITQVLNKKEWFMNFNDAELLAVCKQVFSLTTVPFNPVAAMNKAWIASWKSGKYLGLPKGSEFVAGRFTCQQFEFGVCWAETGKWNNYGSSV